MAKEKDPEFIKWVLEKVCESNGITAKEIKKIDERKQYWPGKVKSNVNSALYQLKEEGKIYPVDPAEGSSAPVWHCPDRDGEGGTSSRPLGSIL